MKLEFACPSDEPRVKHLLAECDLPNEDLKELHLKHFFVIRYGAELAGVVGLEMLDKIALLRSLAVLAPYRQQGIASELVAKAEDYSRSQAVDAVYLLTTTAEGFFAKRGYRPIDRSSVPTAVQQTAEFRSICPSTAICMVKYLSAA